MYLIPILLSVLVIFVDVGLSFVNSYPRFAVYHDGGDPGDALYLTSYIENGDIEKARNLSLVRHPEIPIENYAAYFTVTKEYNSNLFFWFFPAKFNPETAPVLLWLQGGPGASSLFGLFSENGPYGINTTEKLFPLSYSWHLNHNLIYIDNPVGTGYSFTGSDSGYAKNEKDVGKDLLSALHQFFLLFPHLQNNDFFVSGESYGGKYVPAIGYAIYQDSKRQTPDPLKPQINLKGLAIGNGWTDPIHQANYGDYLYQLGLIDSNAHDEFIKQQNQGIECIKKRDFGCANNIFDKLIDGDDSDSGSFFQNLTGYNFYFNYFKTDDDDQTPMGNFVQRSDVRQAIHVGNNTFGDSDGKNIVAEKLQFDEFDSVADWVSELLSNYPILVYNGQLDIICAYPMQVNYLKNLNFSGADEYKVAKRHIWRVDNEVAGYVKHAGNLTEILVRDAGHMSPRDQPKWVLDMLLRFTHHKGFF